MSLASDPIHSGNTLLDYLPREEFDRIFPALQQASLTLRQVIHQYETEITHVYFPTTAMGSMLTILEEDDPVEVGTVGCEGCIGAVVSLGITLSPNRVICQLTGDSWRLPTRAFEEALERGPHLARLIRRYMAFSLKQAGQAMACNALHTVEARACRWLLVIHDQARCEEFAVTHEFMAYMLGVRRQTVTVVLGSLQNAGLIGTRRGSITVRDRAGLEAGTCECYATDKAYYDKVVH